MHSENDISLEPDRQELLSESLSQTNQRSLVFHLLYAIDSCEYESSLASVTDNFSRGFKIVIPKDGAVFKKTLAIIEERAELDALIISLTENWRIERLGTITKLITRIALWEFLHTQLDHLVIINEAIELAKCFGEKDSYKFINGILDNYKKQLPDTSSENPTEP